MSLSTLNGEDAFFHTIRLGHHHTTVFYAFIHQRSMHKTRRQKDFPIIKFDVTVNNTSPPGFDFFKNRAKDDPNRQVEAKSGVTTYNCLHVYLHLARKVASHYHLQTDSNHSRLNNLFYS